MQKGASIRIEKSEGAFRKKKLKEYRKLLIFPISFESLLKGKKSNQLNGFYFQKRLG